MQKPTLRSRLYTGAWKAGLWVIMAVLSWAMAVGWLIGGIRDWMVRWITLGICIGFSLFYDLFHIRFFIEPLTRRFPEFAADHSTFSTAFVATVLLLLIGMFSRGLCERLAGDYRIARWFWVPKFIPAAAGILAATVTTVELTGVRDGDPADVLGFIVSETERVRLEKEAAERFVPNSNDRGGPQ